MSNIPNLASLARLRLWSWGWSTVRRKAFWFDWTDDYISSNATIWRTGYDMNVSGNVTTGSDGDGSYFWINGNKDTAGLWTRADITWGTTPTFTQATDFTIKVRAKIIAVPATDTWWLFGSRFAFNISCYNATNLRFTLRGSSTVDYNSTSAFTLNTMFDAYLVYIATDAKFYVYVDGTLKNVWWTAWPATFTSSTFVVWDNAISWGNPVSSNKYIYHACIRNKALTQAEIDADIALWNTTKQDPSIVAYYVPDNLQYNTQYIANPKALDNASWIKGSSTTVTADAAVAPDWTTTADQVVLPWTSEAVSKIEQNITTLSWSILASKTFIVKAFVKVASSTAPFRLKLWHWWVATYYSSTLTATTTRQEFTFTQTLTSSTSWTNITPWIVTDSGFTAATLLVRNVRLFLVNETLRDESPNIWWFIGRKQNKVLSCRVKPNIDAPDSFTAQGLMEITWARIHVRSSSNVVRIRYDSRLWARESTYALWNWFRDKVHVLWLITWNWSWWTTVLYINWILRDTDNRSVDPQWLSGRSTSLWVWRISTTYFSWNIRDARIYTFTWSFTDADALSIYNWWEPTSAWVTKYLHYRPPVGEVGTTTEDQSSNDRDW